VQFAAPIRQRLRPAGLVIVFPARAAKSFQSHCMIFPLAQRIAIQCCGNHVGTTRTRKQKAPKAKFSKRRTFDLGLIALFGINFASILVINKGQSLNAIQKRAAWGVVRDRLAARRTSRR
jgi:hypothetical protein